MRNYHTNEFSIPEQNKASVWKRFYIYQKERFPLLGHGLLVATFSFSAIAYSRICRGQTGFVNWNTYLIGIFLLPSACFFWFGFLMNLKMPKTMQNIERTTRAVQVGEFKRTKNTWHYRRGASNCCELVLFTKNADDLFYRYCLSEPNGRSFLWRIG